MNPLSLWIEGVILFLAIGFVFNQVVYLRRDIARLTDAMAKPAAKKNNEVKP